MADNSSKTPPPQLTTKQKVIGILTVVIFGFIIYEVIGLFSSGKSAEPTITPPSPASATHAKQGTATSAAPAPAAPQTPAQSNGLTAVNVITLPKGVLDLQKQQEQQEAYLESINQLQLLKVRREIAETNQAIASARLATETANKSMSDLLTQPSLPPAPATSYTTKLEGSGTPIQSTENAEPAKPQAVLDVPFVVVSISMQLNRWNAVLGYQDKLYSISTGDTLFDGSTVVSISKNGVTLMKDGKKRKLSIQASI